MASEDAKHECTDTEVAPPSYEAATCGNNQGNEDVEMPPYTGVENQEEAEKVPLQAESHGASGYDVHMYQQGHGGYYGQSGQPSKQASPLRYDSQPQPMQQVIILSQPSAGAGPQVMHTVGTEQVRIQATNRNTGGTKKYPEYMGWSICNCLCCCWMLGIVAICLSHKTAEANAQGKERMARKLSRAALILNILSPVAAIILGVAYYLIRLALLNSSYSSSYYYVINPTTAKGILFNPYYPATTVDYYFG